MFDWYNNIKYYYEKGYWTIDQVKMAVKKVKITQKQFKKITEQDYTE